MKRAVASFLVILVVAIGYVAITAWRSPPYYKTTQPLKGFTHMSWDEYRQTAGNITPPVLVENHVGDGAVLIFGAEHSKELEHPQFVTLDKEFDRFGPTVVLVEGRLGFLLPALMNPTQTYGESGHLAQLAKRKGLPVYTWELSRKQEVALLKNKYSDEQVAIYLLMRPFPSAATPQAADEKMAALINDRGNRPGINGVVTSVEDLDHIWQTYYAKGPNWRSLQSIYGAPGFLNEMFEYGNDIRDQNLVNTIHELTHMNERVMATVGWSHAVRIRKAIDEMGT